MPEPEITVRQAGELRSAPVESLRALAALAVVESHVYAFHYGLGAVVYRTWWHRTLLGAGDGVYLFFCLTGYLLFLPFARQAFGSGRPVSLGRYVRNRVVRILPLYYVAAVVYLCVFAAPLRDWIAFLTFTENFSTATVNHVDGPMWSLVVEVMFYVLLPFLGAALAWASSRSLGRAAVLLGALAVLSGAYRWVSYLHVAHPSLLVRYNLPATFFFFTPGMLLALLRVAAEQPGWTWPRAIPRSSWWWLGGAVVSWALVFRNYSWDLLAGLGSFLLLGACVLSPVSSLPVRVLGWRPLAWLGTASYSLYIWHEPIVRWLNDRSLGGTLQHLVVAVVVCTAVAAASYYCIESPFLRLRRRWGETAAATATSSGRSAPGGRPKASSRPANG